MTDRALSYKEVSALLAQSMEPLARELLPGGRRAGAEWTAGSVAGEPGTRLSVHLHGAKSGVWKDFAENIGGDALDLVAACLTGGNLPDAYRWACNYLGLTADTDITIRRAEIKKRAEEAQKEQSEAEKKNRASACKLCVDFH